MLAVPPGVVTVIVPDRPTRSSLMVVLESTVKLCAMSPMVTLVVPKKLSPVIVTTPRLALRTGVKEVITGGTKNLKPGTEMESADLIKVILPDAPSPTIAVILLELCIVNEAAGTPPNFTAFTESNWWPNIDTDVPARALAGENEM